MKPRIIAVALLLVVNLLGADAAHADGGGASDAIGACCDGELCDVMIEDDCVASGGEYQGDDTDCDPNPCLPPPAEGACCDGERCSVTTEAACVDGGGKYEGDDSVCDPNPCGAAESDCCIPHATPGCDDETCEASFVLKTRSAAMSSSSGTSSA